jgi:hypothetical protein
LSAPRCSPPAEASFLDRVAMASVRRGEWRGQRRRACSLSGDLAIGLRFRPPGRPRPGCWAVRSWHRNDGIGVAQANRRVTGLVRAASTRLTSAGEQHRQWARSARSWDVAPAGCRSRRHRGRLGSRRLASKRLRRRLPRSCRSGRRPRAQHVQPGGRSPLRGGPRMAANRRRSPAAHRPRHVLAHRAAGGTS